MWAIKNDSIWQVDAQNSRLEDACCLIRSPTHFLDETPVNEIVLGIT